MKVWFAILVGIALFWGGAGILAVKAFGHGCTSMCHMFEAYAISKICGARLNENYATDRKWIGNKLASKFEREAMATWKHRDEVLCNYECNAENSDEGNACHYLRYGPSEHD